MLKTYTYKHPNTITKAPKCIVLNEQEQAVGYCQRMFKNRVTKWVNRAMDHKYFVLHVAELDGEPIAKCKKISRKGRVYYRAELDGYAPFEIGYVGWRDLIPDLKITNGSIVMNLHKEMDDWSIFEYEDVEYARWCAHFNEEKDEFELQLEISEASPIQHAAFYIAIAQTILYVGA